MEQKNRIFATVNADGAMETAPSIDYAINRLERVIAGEKSGISKDIGWQGGGSFSYYEYYDKASIGKVIDLSPLAKAK